MNENQKIEIDLPSYPNGIQLFWGRYDSSNNATFNYHYNVFTYIKGSIPMGGGFPNVLFTSGTSACGWKYIYIKETEIQGSANNSDTSLDTPLGTINNRNWVLQKVIAF